MSINSLCRCIVSSRKGQGPRLHSKENIQQLFAGQNIRMSNLLIQDEYFIVLGVERPKIFLSATVLGYLQAKSHQAIMIYIKLCFFTTREMEVLGGF